MPPCCVSSFINSSSPLSKPSYYFLPVFLLRTSSRACFFCLETFQISALNVIYGHYIFIRFLYRCCQSVWIDCLVTIPHGILWKERVAKGRFHGSLNWSKSSVPCTPLQSQGPAFILALVLVLPGGHGGVIFSFLISWGSLAPRIQCLQRRE